MTFDGLLRQLRDDAAVAAYLVDCGDLRLLPRIRWVADKFDESIAEYINSALRRFANSAGNDDWLAMMSALGASADPGRACLMRGLEWALRRDVAELESSSCGCGHEVPASRP